MDYVGVIMGLYRGSQGMYRIEGLEFRAWVAGSKVRSKG